MSIHKIAFIGFGEVASIFSAEILKKGADVFAYDILLDRENGMETLEKRAQGEGISFLSLTDTLAGADYILSTVTTDVAEEAARSCAVHLKPGQVYLDLVFLSKIHLIAYQYDRNFQFHQLGC